MKKVLWLFCGLTFCAVRFFVNFVVVGLILGWHALKPGITLFLLPLPAVVSMSLAWLGARAYLWENAPFTGVILIISAFFDAVWMSFLLADVFYQEGFAAWFREEGLTFGLVVFILAFAAKFVLPILGIMLARREFSEKAGNEPTQRPEAPNADQVIAVYKSFGSGS